MRPTVLFLRRDDPVGLAVQAFTGSRISHAALGLGDVVVHANGQGVVLEPRTRLRYRVVAEVVIIPDVSDGVEYVLGQVGRLYDLVGFASRPLLRAVRTVFPWWGRRAVAGTGWTCASLVVAVDRRGVIVEWRGLDRVGVDPGELAERTLGAPGGSFIRVR